MRIENKIISLKYLNLYRCTDYYIDYGFLKNARIGNLILPKYTRFLGTGAFVNSRLNYIRFPKRFISLSPISIVRCNIGILDYSKCRNLNLESTRPIIVESTIQTLILPRGYDLQRIGLTEDTNIRNIQFK